MSRFLWNLRIFKGDEVAETGRNRTRADGGVDSGSGHIRSQMNR